MKDLINKWCGKNAQIYIGGLLVDVIVKDIKQSYGRTRFLVAPVSGNGEIWVEQIKELTAF